MSSTSEELTRELHLLRGLTNSSIRPGSVVHGKLSSLIDEVSVLQAQQSTAVPDKSPGGSINVSVVIKHAAYTTPKTISMLSSTSLATLRGYIEATDGPKFEIERLLVRRTGKAWCDFDVKTVAQCEIKDGDQLLADCKSAVENLNPTGLERLSDSRIGASNAFELVALALHCFMLDEAFVAVVELANATPGFAPSLKEVPRTALLANTWNADPSATNFLYKHKAKPGKQFLLSCVAMEDSVIATLSQRGGVSSSTELNLSSYASTDLRPTNIEELQATLRSLVHVLIPSQMVPPPPPTATTATPASAYLVESPPSPSSKSSPPDWGGQGQGQGQGEGGVGGVGGMGPGVGRGDMDPFPGGVHLGPYPGQGGVGPLPPRGNEIGPDHPMFQPGYYDPYSGGGFEGGFEGPGGGYGGVGGLPQPRFDPYGPVLGPNSGVGVGDVGVDGRGRRTDPTGRGRGHGRQGRGFPGAPGEPNPDHFRPPGW